jgi:uncharacterized protein with HEPN domain
MPKRDADLLLEDIAAAIRKVENYKRGLSRQAFLSDEKTVDAVVRNLEIIGEAARQMPQDFAATHPEIPWQRIAGLRNRIVHDYFGLDLEIIWEVIETDIPELKSRLPFSFPAAT